MLPTTEPDNLAAQAVSHQFADRPTLRSVVQQLLSAAINEQYPTLVIDLSQTRLAIPQPGRGWLLKPLLSVVLDYLASDTPLNLDDVEGAAYYLSDQPPKRLRLPGATPTALDMKVIEAVIKALPFTLPEGLQQALVEYWADESGATAHRWHWLAQRLMDNLTDTTLRQPGLDALARETLDQLITTPDREQRAAKHGADAVFAYGLETTLKNDGLTATLLGPEVLLTRVVNGKPVVLLCKPGARLQAFPSIDAFNRAWGQDLSTQYRAATITTNRYEPDGDIFEHQAAMILNQQLDDLGALSLPLKESPPVLEQLYQAITDPGRYFLDAAVSPPRTQATLRPLLPTWLNQAAPDERFAYRHAVLALARAKQQAEGQTFLSGIQDIQAYTVEALQQQMRADRAADASVDGVHPDDLQLTFIVAAGYPGGAGIVEHVRMSLTELAIKNLVARPSGQFTLSHRQGTALPEWLTPDYIAGTQGLIQRVDIGTRYPQQLREQLLGDTPAAHRRETLFRAQQPIQLALLALELSLKKAAGLTPLGARMVAAVMQPDVADQQVDKRTIVVRHLAFQRAPNTRADSVSNMYLIEDQDSQTGPHLLYRPLYAQALLEFASREQLLQAIVQPGDLQTSVLTWLSDGARPIYEHGGFQEPHYVRFGQGSEFDNLERPAPATLANNAINDELLQCLTTGRLMQYLFHEHVKALVEQAERDSVSNRESRWSVMLEGASLLFGSLLLPVLQGPAMLTGLLLALAASLSQDIQALASQDPVARELGAVDLLLNLATLLLTHTTHAPPQQQAVAPWVRDQALKAPLPRRPAGQWPAPLPIEVREGVVALPGILPLSGGMNLDFRFSQARHRLTASQRKRLATFKVTMPDPLPPPVLNGPRKGLYLINNRWHAQVENDLFQVALEPDGNVLIVYPGEVGERGPYLRADNAGGWSIDTRLHLRGGMPPKPGSAAPQSEAQRIRQLQADYAQLEAQQAAWQRAADVAQAVMNATEQDPRYNAAQRADARQRFDAAVQVETNALQNILGSLEERRKLKITLSNKVVAQLLGNTINNARKHVVVAEKDRLALHQANQKFLSDRAGFKLNVIADPTGYLQFVQQVIAINERSIRWLEFKDHCLEQLFNLGAHGTEPFKTLTKDRGDEINALSIKELQLRSLKLMMLKELDRSSLTRLDAAMDPLQQHVRTHAELNALDLSAADRLSVLTSLVKHYGQVLDFLQGLNIVNVEELETEYYAKLFTLLEELYQDAVQRLALEVKPPAQKPKRPPKRPLNVPGKPQKKVIRTTNKDTFIGELKPAGGALPIDVVEVRSTDNNQLLGMYSQRGDEWVEFVEQPAPQPLPAARGLSVVKGEARKLLAMLEEHLRRGEAYRTVCKHPQEIQEILQQDAVKYDRLATELDRAIQAAPEASRTTADQELLGSLRQAAVRLDTLGKTLRTRLSLELPPTDGNVKHLIDEKQVNMALLGERIQLTGQRRDFIQEYAINDSKGYPLWYVHFHYPAADTPKGLYEVAHLKTREQRRQSYYSQLANARNPQAIVDIHRGLLGKGLAERWFLPLAP